MEGLAARLRLIGEQPFTLAGDNPRLVRLHRQWEENPTLLRALEDATGFLLGAGERPTDSGKDRSDG